MSGEPDGSAARDLAFVSSPGQSRAYLGGQLRKAKAGLPVADLWWDVSNFFCGDFSRPSFIPTRKVALPYCRREYFRPPAEHLGFPAEKFRACPFAHFAQFGLKLKERQEYRLAAPDLGQFFHSRPGNDHRRSGG